jgi:hypothetical protein
MLMDDIDGVIIVLKAKHIVILVVDVEMIAKNPIVRTTKQGARRLRRRGRAQETVIISVSILKLGRIYYRGLPR